MPSPAGKLQHMPEIEGGIGVVRMQPVPIGGHTAIAVEVDLPRTHLVVIRADEGYLMCGALDVALLSDRLAAREIVAARAVGVRSVEELLAAPVESATPAAKARGVSVGESGAEALAHMF